MAGYFAVLEVAMERLMMNLTMLKMAKLMAMASV